MDFSKLKRALNTKQDACKLALLTWIKTNEDAIIDQITNTKNQYVDICTTLVNKDYLIREFNGKLCFSKLEREISEELGFQIKLFNTIEYEICIRLELP